VAAAWNLSVGSPPLPIGFVQTWNATNGVDGLSWSITQLSLGPSIFGMTPNPFIPSQILALDGNGLAAYSVDPFAGTNQTYAPSSSAQLITINSIYTGVGRTVWVDAQAPTGVYYTNDGGGAVSLLGPVRCSNCTLLHAVADPLSSTRFFGLCDSTAPSTRRVVRFDTAGACELILDGADFGGLSRMSRLAVAP
jgi:hypothetical protein